MTAPPLQVLLALTGFQRHALDDHHGGRISGGRRRRPARYQGGADRPLVGTHVGEHDLYVFPRRPGDLGHRVHDGPAQELFHHRGPATEHLYPDDRHLGTSFFRAGPYPALQVLGHAEAPVTEGLCGHDIGATWTLVSLGHLRYLRSCSCLAGTAPYMGGLATGLSKGCAMYLATADGDWKMVQPTAWLMLALVTNTE